MIALEAASALRRIRTNVMLSPEDYGEAHTRMIDAMDYAIATMDLLAEMQAKQRGEKHEADL